MAINEVTRLVATVGADVSGLTRGLQQADQKVSGFAKSMNYLLAGGAIAGALTSVGMAINAAFDFSEAGRNIINLEKSFQRMSAQAGQSGDEILAAMSGASQGMIAQTDLMRAYTSTFLLIGQEMANELPRMISVAQKASQAGMGDFQFLLDSLVKGVGRLSPMIIDNLGFTVSLEEANRKYAASLGVTAESLSKAQQQQAMWNAIATDAEKKLGSLDATAGAGAMGGVARLRVAWKEFTDYLKVEFAPEIDAAAQSVVDAVEGMTVGSNANIDRWIEDFKKGQAEFALTANLLDMGPGQGQWLPMMKIDEQLIYQVQEMARSMDMAKLSTEQVASAMSNLAPRSKVAAAEFMAVYDAARTDEKMMRLLRTANDAVTKSFWTSTDAAEKYGISLEGLGSGLEAAQQGAWSRYRQQQKALGNMGTAGGVDPITGEEWFYADQPEALNSVTDGLLAASYGYQELESSGSSAMSSLGSSVDDFASQYNSAMQSLLQPTMSFDLTGSLDQMGLHEDQWDEWARRMGSIMNEGAGSEWLAQLKPEWVGMDDSQIKGMAAQEVGAFYRFEMPELIDTDAIARDFERAMTSEVNYQNVMAMVSQKMEEAGLGPLSAEAIAAWGGPLASSGTDIAGGIAENIEAHDWETSGTAVTEGVKIGALAAAEDPSFRKSLMLKLMPSVREMVEGLLKEYSGGNP